MEAMAMRAGITKPILYRHFTDRAGLCAAIVSRFVEELETEIVDALATTEDDHERLDHVVDVYLRFMERDLNVYRFLVQHAAPEMSAAQRAIDDFVHSLGRLIGGVLRDRLAATGQNTAGAEAWGHGVVGMANAIGDWWLDHQELSRDEVRAYAVSLAWRGLSHMADS
jgi:AcrR family transcriptional regulator